MRLLTVFFLALLPLALQLSAAPIAAQRAPDTPLLVDMPVNGSMECPSRVTQAGINGAVPGGWTVVVLPSDAAPDIENVRYYFSSENPSQRSCNPDIWVEHLEGQDAWIFMAADWKTPPVPGKPFDAALYQQITGLQPGTAYSLSAWMMSLCGGGDPAGYCPAGYYVTKMVGIDSTGGTNPRAGSVQWIENNLNGRPSGWQNMRMAATPQGSTLTIFARAKSPFQWAANQAFLDAVKLVQAPTAAFVNLPAQVYGHNFTVMWTGNLGPDIPLIPNGDYQMYFDLEYRIGGSAANWQPWLTGQAAGSATFGLCNSGVNPVISFRVRPRAEQRVCPTGQTCILAWPNHRFPGVWTESPPVQMNADTSCSPVAFLPIVTR